jgi:phosphatidylserine/phosphatidylglycerophosphate/cardiolipin synthase-like enzyme
MSETPRHRLTGQGPYPIRPGNDVRPLIDGEPVFRRIGDVVESAQFSVWVTVAFLRDGFELPDGRGSFFDVLDRAAGRGLDVRVVFWRPTEELVGWRDVTFWGAPEHLARLEACDPRVLVRWDRSPTRACQHQKSWLVDAGRAESVAFVGGLNLNPQSVVAPGHRSGRDRQVHDVYVELHGPATTDVHHNFVERWNHATEATRTGGHPLELAAMPPPSPTPAVPPRGDSVVQIQRTMPFGERAIFDQYRHAIASAERSIYIENQAIDVPAVLRCLRDALERGVEIVAIVPSEPDELGRGRELSLNALRMLGRFEHFTLAGLALSDGDVARRDVYVHSKVMLVDDEWATIGSCNLHAWSLFGNAELNASFWDPTVVRRLRCDLFAEHLDEQTAHLEPDAAHRRFRAIAQRNRSLWESGSTWRGLALELDPGAYARQRFGPADD